MTEIGSAQFGFAIAAPAVSTKFEVLADDLAFPEGPVALLDGSVLVAEIRGGALVRVMPGGEIRKVAQLGGSPNGAAMGPDGACYVCNSGGFGWRHDERWGWRGHGQAPDYVGGRIERVDLATGQASVLYDNADGIRLHAPNDLVFDRQGGFWFTDSGKVRPDDRDHGAVYYAHPDGSMIRRVVYPFIHPHPNGIGLSPAEDQLYVAESGTGRVWVFEIESPGEVKRLPFPSPNGGRLAASLPGFQMIDSMAIEACGNLCLATVIDGGISVISPTGELVEFIALPDIIPTNICFGGPDMRSAFITLSATSRLISMDWPRPGLALNFLNK